ncbi:MAG: DUF1302 domain-containing protein, partial [Telluria sp.]
MTRDVTPATHFAIRRKADSVVLAAALAATMAGPALAAEFKTSGRLMAGNVYRVQDRDPQLLTTVNAAAIGLPGSGAGGNADDANTNYARGDAVSRAVRALFDVSAAQGAWSGLVRVKAWHDAGQARDARPWGNIPSSYAAGQPLEDSGAPRLTRFSGVALLDAWVQGSGSLAGMPVLGRVGQQSLRWGERSITPGGIEALNPRDMPGSRRAAPVAAETIVPRPMLFGRVEPVPGLAFEGYLQTVFRPTALDACGTLWSMSDYQVDGCDKVMSGQPQVSDRARIPLGAYKKRLPTPKPEAKEFGLGLSWTTGGTEFGLTEFSLYHARYNARTALPGLRRSLRPNGPALIAGDPDGRNMAYYTEYPEGLRISAATWSHKRGASTVVGELSYRPAVPFMLAPGDVMPPFLSATAPSLLRARANAVPPGGIFRGYDLYGMWQAQFGVRHEWVLAGLPLAVSAEAVGKHARGLPDPAVMRYGRADIFGVGAINGACVVNTGDAARQCSLRG